MPQESMTPEDEMTLIWVGAFIISTGAISLTVILEPARDWLTRLGLLATGSDILIPIADGVGIGAAQLIVAVCIIGIIMAITVWGARRRRQRI